MRLVRETAVGRDGGDRVVGLALANAGEVVVRKPLAVHTVAAGADGTVRVMDGGRLTVDAGADLSGVTIAVDTGVGLNTTFLVMKGDLAGEPTLALPGKAYVQKKTNAEGETEWSYAKRGMVLIFR